MDGGRGIIAPPLIVHHLEDGAGDCHCIRAIDFLGGHRQTNPSRDPFGMCIEPFVHIGVNVLAGTAKFNGNITSRAAEKIGAILTDRTQGEGASLNLIYAIDKPKEAPAEPTAAPAATG